jgi:raffinose/stachyose/melibiose transport system substrate-binding protein
MASGPVTIKLFSGSGTVTTNQALANGFNKSQSAVKVVLMTVPDTDYNTALPRDLRTSSGPDVFAPSALVQEVADSEVLNLSSYASKYGWTAKFSAQALAPGRVSSKGVVGRGPLYQAGGQAGVVTGIFYNHALMAKLGLHVPKTVSQFSAELATAKAKGVTPIICSNEDGLTGHLFDMLLGDYMGAQGIDDVIDNVPGSNLDTPDAVAAADLLGSWMSAGYFNSDANAIQQTQSYQEFGAGDGLFLVSGSWIESGGNFPASFNYGMMPFPPLTVGGPYVGMESNDLAFSISAKSAYPDQAAQFVNWLSTPAAAKVIVTVGGGNAYGLAPIVSPSLNASLKAQTENVYQLVQKGDGVLNWLQNQGPIVNSDFPPELQLLMAGKTTGADMIQKFAADVVADRQATS